MNFLAELFGFLLDQGEYVVAFVLFVLAPGGAWLYRRRRNEKALPEPQGSAGSQSQTNVMSNVKTKGDIEFSPRQDRG
jgi:hypothetical protein